MTDDELENQERLREKYFRNFSRAKTIEKIKTIFMMKEHGWINLSIEFSQLKITIWLSSVFDPIPDIIGFIRKIRLGAKTAELYIDEEGHFKIVEFFKQDDDDDDIYVIKITSRGLIQKKGYDEYQVLKTISRRVFLEQLTEGIRTLGKNNIGKSWYNYDLGKFIAIGLEDNE